MPRSRGKVKKSIITSATAIISLTEELESTFCCSKRNCPSHAHYRLTEKFRIFQQSKLKAPSPPPKRVSPNPVSNAKPIKRCYKLPHSKVLSKLLPMTNNHHQPLIKEQNEIYSSPVPKSIVLEKHEAFAKRIEENFQTIDDLPYSFTKTSLQPQIEYRMISLGADPFTDQMDRMEASEQLKINLLRINHVHSNSRLPLKIISTPIWTRYAVHIVVQDENSHCLHLSIYNWSPTVNTRQVKPYQYIQECLLRLLPLNSCIVLLDPWLKVCEDGEISLRCESPNTHLLMIDFETRCSTNSRTNLDQLRQWGNACYQADDNLRAIEFYTYGLRQLEEQQEKELKTSSADERQQHRIRFLSNRCACYLRERHATLALADTSVLLSIDELSHALNSPKATAGKLLFRCLSAHLHLGLFNKVESLLKSHQFGAGLNNGENSASIAILERELLRLREESTRGRYDLAGILREQIVMHTNGKPPLMFLDLAHFHAECQRNDLCQVRPCRPEEISKNGYPKGSYGVYALKNLEVGTLLVVEQPFASIDNRLIPDQRSHSVNFWRTNGKTNAVQYCDDETLRLLNEIEKQLLIGNTSWMTFEKLKLMQPIRQWLKEIHTDQEVEEENEEENIDLVEDDQTNLPFHRQWKNAFSKRSPPPASFIPWRILFETQQQNPFRSKSTLAWYSLGSMFNHSCLPNCVWYLLGDYLFIYVCSSTIRQGDELTISYCPLWISSLNERAIYLRQLNIHSCRCSLCSYDRSNMPQYEIELKKFANVRALVRQKNISQEKRLELIQKLKHVYEYILKKFRQRPMGFLAEFCDLEVLSQTFHKEKNPSKEIEEFLEERQISFLQRLARVTRLTIKDLPKRPNPIALFGHQTQLLIHHLEHHYSHVHSCDLKQWNCLLECLYEIYTFKCHSSTNNMQKTLRDLGELVRHLDQTQTVFFQRTF